MIQKGLRQRFKNNFEKNKTFSVSINHWHWFWQWNECLFEWWNWSPFYIFKVRLFNVLYYAFEANKEWKLRPEPISGFQKPEADKIIFASSTAGVTLDINRKLNGPMYRIVYIERQMGSFSYCCVCTLGYTVLHAQWKRVSFLNYL